MRRQGDTQDRAASTQQALPRAARRYPAESDRTGRRYCRKGSLFVFFSKIILCAVSLGLLLVLLAGARVRACLPCQLNGNPRAATPPLIQKVPSQPRESHKRAWRMGEKERVFDGWRGTASTDTNKRTHMERMGRLRHALSKGPNEASPIRHSPRRPCPFFLANPSADVLGAGYLRLCSREMRRTKASCRQGWVGVCSTLLCGVPCHVGEGTGSGWDPTRRHPPSLPGSGHWPGVKAGNRGVCHFRCVSETASPVGDLGREARTPMENSLQDSLGMAQGRRATGAHDAATTYQKTPGCRG